MKPTQVNRKRIALIVAMILSLFATHIHSIADTDGIVIEGPWLWMVVPTDAEEGDDVSTEIDSLAAASDGVVTETLIAKNGVREGDSVGELQWVSSVIADAEVCVEFSGLGFLTINTETECWENNLNEVFKPLEFGTGENMKEHTAYALIYLVSPRNVVGTMQMTSGDGLKVWLNGEVVHRQAAIHLDCRKVDIFAAGDARTCTPDPRDWEANAAKTNAFPVTLKAGNNLLLVKVRQNGEYWDMRVELDADFITSTQLLPLAIVPTPSQLAETTLLDESTVTLSIVGKTFERDVAKIRNAVSVSGIDGVTLEANHVTRVSDTEVSVTLDFDNTDFDDEPRLTFSVDAEAIAHYNGAALIAEIVVSGVEESVSVSSVSELTELTLDGSVVTLTLSSRTYERDIAKIRGAMSVSGIPGVTIRADSVTRVSDTEVSVALDFDGTDFDDEPRLTFSVDARAIAHYKGAGLTDRTSRVESRDESVSVRAASPLREATLDGSIVTLTLTDVTYERDVAKIRDAVSVSGIDGVTIRADSVTRVSDISVSVELDFDGTTFATSKPLTFRIGARAIVNYTGAVLTAETRPVTPSREARVSIYWTDLRAGRIQRANADGSNVETLIDGLDTPYGIALDVAGGKIYWTDPGADKIQRANLDGTNVETLIDGLLSPHGIVLDVAGGKIYWTDPGTDKIQRANYLDGSNVEDLVEGWRVADDSYGIALDVAGGKVYWTDRFDDKIRRANLDGSNVETLIGGLESPYGIALDVAGGKIYWVEDFRGDRIRRANLDGSNVETLVRGLEDPRGIILDVAGGKMYWTDRWERKIQRANLDGSNVEDLLTGLSPPNGIAVAITSPESLETVAEDVNRDGVVDAQDLVYISQRYGRQGQNQADVNEDGVVNIDDLILVAAVIDNAAAAPSVRSQRPKDLTVAVVNQWLTEAKLTGKRTLAYQRGIRFLEQLLAALTPKETALLANYPNPFNPETWIPYHLSNDAVVTLIIYDSSGQVIRTIDVGHQVAAAYESRAKAIYWDGRNAVGEQVSSGVYFYHLSAGDYSATRKMLVIK